MSSPINLTFCTGVGTVTGANFLLEVGERKLLIDCGLVQDERVGAVQNKESFQYDPKAIDVLLVTHAHLDHVGRIPKLIKEGFHGVIYSTSQTRELAQIVLNDAVRLLAQEAIKEGEEPLYSSEDVSNAFSFWKIIDYHTLTEIIPGISIYSKDAGHILGSAMIEIKIKNTDFGIKSEKDTTSILFTGDLGNSPSPLLRDTEEIGNVDYMIMESVYGDRNHEDKEGRDNQFRKVIIDTINRGGTLVIPAFSIDRTQVLLYELNNMTETGKIPEVPVFVDSPMATLATQIYSESTNLFNDNVQSQIKRGDNVFSFPKLKFTSTQWESREIESVTGPKIILAGSGMSIGGRVIGHEEKYLGDQKSTILLVGYQTPGSIGRQLADGNKKIKIYRDTYKVKAHIETLYGYSAHKDSNHLVEMVANTEKKPKKIFVAMGEFGASMHLAQRLNDEVGAKAMVPERLKKYTLE
jgi:metallo-beta-lactamase family protein